MSNFYNIPTPEEAFGHFTGIPNVFFDKIMPMLDAHSWQILCVFLRNLYGFNRNTYCLSIRVIAKQTGLSQPTVLNRLHKLLDSGLIIKTKVEDKPNRIAAEYGLFTGKIKL